MKRIFYGYGSGVPLLVFALLFLIATPVSAASQTKQQRASTTNLNASVYLATQSLKSLFQDQINQQVTSLSNSMMNTMLSSLPAADQGWAKSMAGALIQPSATLTQLTPQNDGLDTRLSLSLYPGDPKPINAEMLVTFSVLNASTIQVNAKPMPGSPQLANGPLTTIAVPIGQLESINTTPGCGDIALKINIQMPVDISTASTQSQNNPMTHSVLSGNQIRADIQQSHVAYTTLNRAANTLNAYVEITNSSLNALGSSIGPIVVQTLQPPFGKPITFTAENLNINTQGSGLVINAYIHPTPPPPPIVTTFVQPSAENGQLVMHVPNKSTTISVGIFSIHTDSYNQTIENMLNSNLGNALAGKFTVNGVSVGGAPSCAAGNSLILQGTTSLG